MNKFLTTVFLISVVVLLALARFGFEFAGGQGYEKPMTATVVFYSTENVPIKQDDLARGEMLETVDGEYAVVRIGEKIKIAMDQRTVVTIERLFSSKVEVIIIRGRVLAKISPETEKLAIVSPYASGTITDGVITAARYDFLDQTVYAPLGSKIFVEIKNDQSFDLDDRAVVVDELHLDRSGLTDFNHQAAAVVDFYDWAFKITQ